MAANAYTKELLMSMSTNDRQLLESIDSALYRIAEGEYGYCDNCGDLIQEKRLEGLPWAHHCVKCQVMNERGLLSAEEEEYSTYRLPRAVIAAFREIGRPHLFLVRCCGAGA